MSHVSRRTLLASTGLVGLAGLAGAGVAPAHAARKSQSLAPIPMAVCYVEVNSNPLSSVAKYSRADTGAPLFGMGLIFAANINADAAGNAVLGWNAQVQSTLDNAATQIRPLQARGIKVVLSILGNHAGVGFANFPDQAAAEDFAQQVADTVYAYGLDGVDLDDEWAEYGKNGTAQPNAWSFVYLVTALRQAMPDKLITFYNIGPSAQRTSYNGVNAGDTLDYAWNPYYGTWGVPQIAGMTKPQLGPAAVQITATPPSTTQSLAARTITEGYGVFVTYNLTATNSASYLSNVSQPLWGTNAVYTD